MARLHLVLGYRSMEADPSVLYCGRDAEKARAYRDSAVETRKFKCVEITEPQRGNRRFCQVVPDDKVPDDKVPDDKVPDDKVPDDKVPDDKVPDDKVPDDKVQKTKSQRSLL